MHRAWLFPASVAAVVAALIASTRLPAPLDAALPAAVPSDAPVRHADRAADEEARESLQAIEHYVDPDFGFTLAIPAGWNAVVAAESEAQMAMHEPGYAVGFESPREHADDVFSDYLMIELLPGAESGLFETNGSRRRPVTIDGRAAWRDELTIAAGAFGNRPAASVSGRSSREEPRAGDGRELVVRQAAIVGLGYTVGLYAIGESTREALMGDAFEMMLRTFRLTRAPFDVS